MEWIVTFVTLVTGLVTIPTSTVTIIWFIRDVRKENSKVLKAILEAEQNQTNALEKLSRALEKISEMLLNQTKILEKVAAK